MSEIPSDLAYTKTHEWIQQDDDGSVLVGITDYAQESLGDLVFVELPEVGETLSAGDACAVVESVKAASDIYAPVTGEVLEVNDDLTDSPEHVNQDAYGSGWLMKIKLADESDLDDLLDADAYEQFIEDEA